MSRIQRVLTTLVALYLATPVVLFLLTWLQPAWGLPLGALTVLGSWLAWRNASPDHVFGQPGEPGFTHLQWLAIVLVALIWSALGGAGHLFYANYFDWHVRDALLMDLARHLGPIGFKLSSQNAVWLLRCPLGYFLVPALAAKLWGEQLGQLFLLAWTFLGVFLFLSLAASLRSGWRHVTLTLLILPLFGGMDWLGGWILAHPLPLFSTVHLQWWAGLFQYSSASTQLFWVPNHALPGWLLAACLYLHWHNPKAIRTIPWWIAVMPLWSPLTTIGVIPLLAVWFFKHVRHNQATLFAGAGVALCLLPPAILCAAYLTMDSAGVPSNWTMQALPFAQWLRLYGAFISLEFGILWVLLLRTRREALLLTSGIILLVLPLYRLGLANDLAMRASIAPLIILALYAVERLGNSTANGVAHKKGHHLLIAVLCLGAITGLHEIARALVLPRWNSPPYANTFVETSGVAHYFARIDNGFLSTKLAPGTIIQLQIQPVNAAKAAAH